MPLKTSTSLRYAMPVGNQWMCLSKLCMTTVFCWTYSYVACYLPYCWHCLLLQDCGGMWRRSWSFIMSRKQPSISTELNSDNATTPSAD